MVVETLTPTPNFRHLVTIEGWVLSGHETRDLTLLFQGKEITVKPNIARPDILEKHPTYPSQIAGFRVTLDTFAYFQNTIFKLRAKDGFGQTVEHLGAIRKDEETTFGFIDGPKNLAHLETGQMFSGWFFTKGKSKILVKQENRILGEATFVANTSIVPAELAYQANDPLSWVFSYNEPFEETTDGRLNFCFYENDQLVHEETLHFNRLAIEEFVIFETDFTQLEINDKPLTVVGHYVSANPQPLQIKIGSLLPIAMDSSLFRPDLAERYPYLSDLNIGFEATFDLSELPPGTHTLTSQILSISSRSVFETKEVLGQLSFVKKKTVWVDPLIEGDLLSKDVFFKELKQNMVSVIQDYVGKGVENEAQLIAQTNELFTGDIMPARNDWVILSNILNELAKIKEFSVGYDLFLEDVSDSLGVSDLVQIKQFVDYIQTLKPQKSEVTVELGAPGTYTMTSLQATSSNQFKSSVTLNWTNNVLSHPNATIRFTDSPSEDIASYFLRLTAGSYQLNQKYNLSDPRLFTQPLYWANWFGEGNQQVSFTAQVQSIDKRGNYSDIGSMTARYPANTVIPTTPGTYVLEWQINNGPWIRLTETKNTTFTQTIGWNTYGPATYRIKAIDKHNQYETPWFYSNAVTINNEAPFPSKPNPSVKTDYNSAVLSWPACAYADYYRAYAGTNMNTASTNGQYTWTYGLSSTVNNLAENTNYTFTVEAVNKRGNVVSTCAGKTKNRTPKTLNLNGSGVKTYRGAYHFTNYYNNITWYGAGWRSENEVIQGEWIDYYKTGFQWRTSGSGYWSWHDQAWGINTGYYIVDYSKLRSTLKNKQIQSVTLKMRRGGGNHGWSTGNPIHWISHNETSTTKSGGRGATFGALLSQVSVDANNYVTISDNNTKLLIQRIVDGSATGFGLYKEYNGSKVRMDKAYMRFLNYLTISVTYIDK